MRAGHYPPTARQLALLDRLLTERDTRAVTVPRHLGDLDLHGASHLIAQLEAQPRRPGAPRPGKPVNANGAGPGVYDLGGDVFRLRVNQAGTGVYPERLILGDGPPRWQHAPEVSRRILPSQRLTVARATQLGAESQVCVVCGTPLEDPRSKAAGIGWRCAGKLRR